MGKREPTAEEILKAMYPDIPTRDDFEQKNDTTKQTANQPNAEVAELRAQIAALQSRLDGQSRAHTAIQTRQVEVPPQPPKIDMKQAPNPVDDPEGYAVFVQNAIDAKVQYEKDLFDWQNRQQVSVAQQTQNLWDSFSAKYKDYAKDTKKVAIAAREVTDRARAARRDVDKYMYDTSDEFMRDVAAEMDALWGKPKATEQSADVEVDDENEDDGRTGGLFGGGQQSVFERAAGNPAQPKPKYTQMSQDIIDWQKKNGLRH